MSSNLKNNSYTVEAIVEFINAALTDLPDEECKEILDEVTKEVKSIRETIK